jgi:hypothetical protein
MRPGAPMKPLLLLLVLTSSTVAVHALTQQLLARHTHTGHAGRLDKNGGHVDKSTGIYHFHR